MAARNIPVIICNQKFQPVSIAQPIIQHNNQTRRFEAQAKAKKGLKNRIWQRLVIGKVKNQHQLLKLKQSDSAERLNRLASLVKPGDPENIEAQAAQVYWPALFGTDFRRNREEKGINSMLNYGYAIIRSSMTSAVLSAGLHPTFGIFHHNRNNPFCLVDDLIEPYRPMVDQVIYRLEQKGYSDVTPEVKRCLASIATSDQATTGSTSPLFQHMHSLCYTLWEAIEQEKAIPLPMPQLLAELEVEAMVSSC